MNSWTCRNCFRIRAFYKFKPFNLLSFNNQERLKSNFQSVSKVFNLSLSDWLVVPKSLFDWLRAPTGQHQNESLENIGVMRLEQGYQMVKRLRTTWIFNLLKKCFGLSNLTPPQKLSIWAITHGELNFHNMQCFLTKKWTSALN